MSAGMLYEPLRPEELRCGLKTRIFGQGQIHYYTETDSTNTQAKKAGESGGREGELFVAESQSAGRGRRGRTWYSEAGFGIIMSLLLRPSFSSRHLALLPLLTGVAVAEAIEEATRIKAGVKWPNDLLVNGRKVAGILTEAGFDRDRIDYAVIGIGLNVNTPQSGFPAELRAVATSLRAESGGEIIPRAPVARAMLEHFERHYLHAQERGFDEALELWRKHTCTLGHPVTVRQDETTIRGLAEDITEDGALVVRVAEGQTVIVHCGDVVPEIILPSR